MCSICSRSRSDLASIAGCVTTPEQGAELYLASRLAIDPDEPAERAYLDALATRLKLPAELRAHLEQQAALPEALNRRAAERGGGGGGGGPPPFFFLSRPAIEGFFTLYQGRSRAVVFHEPAAVFLREADRSWRSVWWRPSSGVITPGSELEVAESSPPAPHPGETSPR